MNKRLLPEIRAADLLAAALRVATRNGWRTLTREAVATEAQVSPGLVSLHLGTVDNMRRDVMRAAIRERCVRVVAEGLALNDRHARKAPDELKLAAAEWVKQ